MQTEKISVINTCLTKGWYSVDSSILIIQQEYKLFAYGWPINTLKDV